MLTIAATAHTARLDADDDVIVSMSKTTEHIYITHGVDDCEKTIPVMDEDQASALILAIKAVSAALGWNISCACD